MKKLFVKAWLLGIALGFSIEYSRASGYFDTTLNARLLLKSDSSDARVICANVLYPDILKNNEAHTLKYIESFSVTRKNYLIRTFNRSKKYFPKVTAILKKYDLPEEFRVLMALESGFNGNAVSSAGAVGYWQFMDNVAREYGLKIVEKKRKYKSSKTKRKTTKKAVRPDERKDFLKSTYAAARYLKDRSRNLNNDWLLIAASYNWGIGNVWNAMERTGKENPTFWDIKKYLPAETRSYVMNFIALNVIFHNYENFISDNLIFNDIVITDELADSE